MKESRSVLIGYFKPVGTFFSAIDAAKSNTDPFHGGQLSNGGPGSEIYGLIAWIVVGVAALALLIVLIFNKKSRTNKMSSGRERARKRSASYNRKRLLDDQYYQNWNRKNKRF